MCGFSFIASSRQQIACADIKKMNNIIKHRGPDDEGYYVWSKEHSLKLKGVDTPDFQELKTVQNISELEDQNFNLLMGHRRLSIIDLSVYGHQPMESKDGRYQIVFNGEIYNYKEIRETLVNDGKLFDSTSDTEVIIESYRKWGHECLNYFNGMFAFILWDKIKGVIFGARDRFGIKPFYYYESSDDVIYAGSEIKQIVPFISEQAKINKKRVYDYLIWGQTDHTDETLFDEVYQLPGGCFFEFDINEPSIRLNVERYYDLSSKLKKSNLPYDEAVKTYKYLFDKSVKFQLRSDVLVGTCLSGGLDSSSILSTVLEQKKPDSELINTFSNCSKLKKYDEQEFIDCYKNEHNVIQHKIFPDIQDLYLDLEELIYYHDEPFLSTSVFAEWSVFKLVATDSKVKVTLDGHGADEQLIGYHTFIPSILGSLFRSFSWLQLYKEIKSIHLNHGYSYSSLFYKLSFSILPAFVSKRLLKMTNRIDANPVWMNLEGVNISEHALERIQQNAKGNIEEISYTQVIKSSIPKQLKWSDRNSMRRGIESRVPFLDHNLVEFVLSLPISYRFKTGITKRILRDAMIDTLPEKIRTRIGKMGYVTPEETWFKSQEKGNIKSLIKESIIASDGLLLPELESIVDDIVEGEKPYRKIVWRSICLGQWMKVFSLKN